MTRTGYNTQNPPPFTARPTQATYPFHVCALEFLRENNDDDFRSCSQQNH